MSFGLNSSKMQTTATTLTVFIAVLSLTACEQKKEDYQMSPTGYWRGHTEGFQTAILNRKNGSSRFYFKIPGTDTANSKVKVEGTYKLTDCAFEGKYPSADDTVSLECTMISEQEMFGFMTLISAEPVSVDLERQP
jgi:hypothetical protein